MFKNYIKIAFRNLWKHKVFSMINIISLSIGLSAAFVIGLMVYFDFTFDTFHKDGDRIYRLVSDFESPEGNHSNPGIPVPLHTAAKEEMSGIETVAYLYQWYASTVQAEGSDKKFRNQDFIIFTEANYFEIFQYEWLAGNATNILQNPNEVVISKNRAQQYFPNTPVAEVIGRSIDYDGTTAKIKGVVQNFDKNTDIVFEEFISLPTAKQTGRNRQIFNDSWGTISSSSQAFVKIAPAAKTADIRSQLKALAIAHPDEYSLKYGTKTYFNIQPLSDIHFNNEYGIYNYEQEQASKEVLVALGFIALFLLLLGIVNFINLNTAQASQRAKEIGVRKTLGSSKKQLMFQFLSETFLLTLIAGILSIVLSLFLLQVFSDFIPSGLDASLLLQPIILFCIVLLLLIVTLFSGFYPGVVLSHFKPVSVLKGHQNLGSSKVNMRKGLTIFQFTIAQIFVLGTLLVGKQINYLMEKDMGFDSETTAYIQTPWGDKNYSKKEVLGNALKKLPQITKVSHASMPPASNSTFSTNISFFNEGVETKTELELIYGDHAYFDLYDIQLLAGRKPLNDTIREYVINETALNRLGYTDPEKIIGKSFIEQENPYAIVGVMEDFNQRSLKTNIEPMAFSGDVSRKNWSQFSNIHFSIPAKSQTDMKALRTTLESELKKVYPDAVFQLNFNDVTVANFYSREQRMSELLNWATGLSVLISCLGLLGLVIHTTERRTKEIGVRKVLGASLTQLNALLCKDFLVLVGVAFVIAVPIAWWGLNKWFQDFAYKTEMSWWIFILSGLAMVFVALLVMSIRTISTASKNPVNSLRTE